MLYGCWLMQALRLSTLTPLFSFLLPELLMNQAGGLESPRLSPEEDFPRHGRCKLLWRIGFARMLLAFGATKLCSYTPALQRLGGGY